MNVILAVLLGFSITLWLAAAAWLLVNLQQLPKSERAACDWIIFGLWPITIPLLMLYDLAVWARRKWAVRKRDHG
jgi:hypothetical protein